MQKARGGLQPIRDNLSRIWTGAKGAFTEYLAYNALEGAVLGVFDCFTAEEVAESILEYGEAVDGGDEPEGLWEVDWSDFEEFRLQFQMLAKDPRFSRYVGLLDAENVLAWLGAGDGRPKLASLIINTPRGLEWLEFQIADLKRGLLKPIVEESVVEQGIGEA